jgi:nitrogen fixation protein FixH
MKWNFGTGIAAVYSIFALSMLTAAIRSTHYDVGLVKKDYYADDLNYQQHFNKIQNEKGSVERLKIERNVIAMNEATEGSLTLQFPKTQTPPNGTITFFRPSKVGIDQIFDLKTNADNTMVIPTKAMIRGAWKIQIDWTANGTAFYREENITL